MNNPNQPSTEMRDLLIRLDQKVTDIMTALSNHNLRVDRMEDRITNDERDMIQTKTRLLSLEKRMDDAENETAELSTWKAQTNGGIAGMRWVAVVAVATISFLVSQFVDLSYIAKRAEGMPEAQAAAAR